MVVEIHSTGICTLKVPAIEEMEIIEIWSIEV
jgi:hypothetical protein